MEIQVCRIRVAQYMLHSGMQHVHKYDSPSLKVVHKVCRNIFSICNKGKFAMAPLSCNLQLLELQLHSHCPERRPRWVTDMCQEVVNSHQVCMLEAIRLPVF